jgi:hypothetical protein
MSIYQKILIPVLCLAPFAACSDSEGGGNGGGNGDVCPHDYSKFQETKPAVSLRNDLLTARGTFRFSCAFNTTCHGNPDRSQANLYLGQQGEDGGVAIDEMANLVHAGMVGQPSQAAPGIPLVDPGKPETSFLMMKLDGCLDDVEAQCEGTASRLTDHPCGSLMPEGNKDPLPAVERDLIRTWIKQGAPNN